MRTLKEVAIVSLFGALASVGLVIIIIILGIADYPSHVGQVEHQIIRLHSLPIAMGAIAFSFGGNFVVRFSSSLTLQVSRSRAFHAPP